MDTSKLLDEKHESVSTPKKTKIGCKRKESVSRNVVFYMNDDSGEERTTSQVFVPGDLVEQSAHLVSMVRVSHVEANQRCHFAITGYAAASRYIAKPCIDIFFLPDAQP